MQPMNYTIQTGNPGESFQQGMQQTAGMMATVADYQKAQALATAAQQKAEHDAYKRQRFMDVARNPTTKDVEKLMLEFPELHEGVGKVREFMSADELRNTHALASSVSFALENNNPDAAIKLIDQQYEAARSSGNQDAMQRMSTLRDSVLSGGAQFGLRMMLAGTMSPKEWADYKERTDKNKRENELQPALVEKGKADASEAQSKATIAAAKSKFAESDAALELEKKGWDIKKIQEDIKINKINSQIAAMNAQTSRMNAGTAAAEKNIKLQELIDKRDTAVREKVAEAESTRASMDNLLNVTDKILKTPKSVVGSAAGPISSRIPTLSQKTADFEALIETAGNLITMSNMGSMKGVLSDSDLKVLRGSVQNLSLSQSPEALISNVKEVQRITLKSRKALAQKYGIPDSVPDTPAATPSASNIDALLKKYGQ